MATMSFDVPHNMANQIKDFVKAGFLLQNRMLSWPL
jgi:hypothetical protein